VVATRPVDFRKGDMMPQAAVDVGLDPFFGLVVFRLCVAVGNG